MKNIITISANTSWYIYNFRLNLIKEIQKLGFEVCVIAPKDEYSVKLQKEECIFVNLRLDNKSINPVSEIKVVKEYHRIYKFIKPKIALHYTPKANIYGSFAAGMLNLPCINNIAGLGNAFIKKGILSKVVSTLYFFSQRKTSLIFFQNPDDLKMFLAFRLVRAEKTVLLPGSGVDIQKFKPLILKKKSKVRPICFLLIARLIWDKGIGEFSAAARFLKKKYPELRFCLLGFVDSNNPAAVSEKQICEWEAEGILNWLGKTDDVRPYIADSTCVVLPSYYREGTPKSLLEAASMGKPLITADSVGCRQTVDVGINGYLCQPRDAEDLADKMEKIILMTPEEIDIMGQESRKKMVREFDERIVISAYLKAIADILYHNKLYQEGPRAYKRAAVVLAE